jgi:PhoPQ-activated pathogenicity-related protein
MYQSEDLVESLVKAISDNHDEEDLLIIREALHALTRLARAEERSKLVSEQDWVAEPVVRPKKWLH